MTENRFIEEKSENWRELELLLKPRAKKSLKISFFSLSRLDALYRLSSSDLAYAQTHYPNSDVTAYLNQLVASAHNRFYSEKRKSLRSVAAFFTEGLPGALRQSFLAILAAFLVFATGAVFSYLFTYFRPETVGVFLGKMAEGLNFDQSGQVMWDMPVMSSYVMTNNIRVSILAMVLGVTFGAGTAYVLFANGLILGSLSAIMTLKSNPLIYWSLILPHGVLELSAIFISGGAGFLIAKAILRPGRFRRSDALRIYGGDALKLMGAACPLLVIAGVIEGFLTPSALSPVVKLAFAAATGVLLVFYFLLGRKKPEQEADETER